MFAADAKTKTFRSGRRVTLLALVALATVLVFPVFGRAETRTVALTSGWWAGYAPISQNYGCTTFRAEPWNANCATHHFHSGLDVGLGCGRALTVPTGATVVSIGRPAWAGPYSPKLRLDGDGGHDILLAHVKKVYVKAGDHVAAGTHVADVGSMVGPGGTSTGCHLHFEVDVAGSQNSINPVPFLNPSFKPTPPGAPTGVAAAGNNASAVVSWTPPASNGGSAITGYVVASAAGTVTVGATTTATVNGLTNGATYTFTVRAVNAIGTGPDSAPSNAVTPGALPQLPNGWFAVVNKNSGKCIDARGASTVYGTALQQYTCNNTPAQLWQFVPTGDGYYRVNYRNAATEVWDITGVSGTAGAKAELWGWNGGNNQQWYPVAEPGGYYHFRARHSGQCLDTPGALTSDGLQLQQYPCNGNAAQSFRLALPGVRGTVSVPSGQTLNVRSGPGSTYSVIASLQNGTVVTIVCQAHASTVSGMWGATSLWDRLSTGGYVSDGFVNTGSNGQVAPNC